MALWLVRAGKRGEHENRFLQDQSVYLTFEVLDRLDLNSVHDFHSLRSHLQERLVGESNRLIGNWCGQAWTFAKSMQIGDLVVLPSKKARTMAVGVIDGPYRYIEDFPPAYRHIRCVQWLDTAIPWESFDEDLLRTMGAFLTVFEVKRNDAEKRVRHMLHVMQT